MKSSFIALQLRIRDEGFVFNADGRDSGVYPVGSGDPAATICRWSPAQGIASVKNHETRCIVIEARAALPYIRRGDLPFAR